MVRIY